MGICSVPRSALRVFISAPLRPRDRTSLELIDVTLSIDKNFSADQTPSLRYAAVPRWMEGNGMNEIVLFSSSRQHGERETGPFQMQLHTTA